MSKNTYIVAVCLVLALCFMHSGDAIKCYRCKSFSDANCAKEKIEPSMNIMQVDCDSEEKPHTMDQYLPVTKCNKVVTSDNAGLIVSRGCHFEIVGQKKDECSVSHSRQIQSCHICKGDLCNASSAGRFVAMGMAALIAVVGMQFVL
ncbi:uncharacterized protein LOC119688088 [Teleopsis dalmanni]|uniref:uncharacterized protein LOC119688088 n=1 Tax=Teleopsis dalmanni TaxID=139649 RepID=UPI0018CD57C7|nr:uncharacterized protein LOC119688088 [Teleopsis dalmanni]